jgi:hypothetical protein
VNVSDADIRMDRRAVGGHTPLYRYADRVTAEVEGASTIR